MTIENAIKLRPKSPHRHTKITEQTLRTIATREKPYFIKDTQLTGFAIKVNPTGRNVYRVEARLGGTGPNKNITIGDINLYSVKEARQKATALLKQIREGNDPVAEKRQQQLSACPIKSSSTTVMFVI